MWSLPPVLRRGGLVLLLVLLGWASQARAARIVIDAVVRPDLQTIVGEARVEDGEGIHFEEILSRLPSPTDDVLARRTFPGTPETGWVDLSTDAAGVTHFHALIPRRYGASGLVPGHGVFLNGLWHPIPTRGGRPADVTWDVRLALPDGAVGVLNGQVGTEEVTWTGEADRLSLAVVPDGRVETLDVPAGRALVVDHGPPRYKRDYQLAVLVSEAWPGPDAPDLVIVEAPMHRRLVRSGPGMLFLSDRAFRLTGGLRQFHGPAVQRGILEAALPIADRWSRQFAAAAFTEASAPETDLRKRLGWVSWVPQVDSLLYDGRLPYYGDVFGEVWPGDAVRDDADELLADRTPPLAIVRRVEARYGVGTALKLAWALVQGSPLPFAAARVGIPLERIDSWLPRPPPQALALDVAHTEGGGATVTVTRTAPAVVPPEPIVVDIDGTRRVWEAPAGDGVYTTTLPNAPDKVRLDPDGSVNQADRADDRWPVRLSTTAAFFPYELNVRGGGFSAAAYLTFRRQYSSRWRTDVGIETSPEDIVAATIGAVRYLGPLQDRRNRPFRIWFGAGPSFLDPDFRPTNGHPLALGGYIGASWETRVDSDFPRHGQRVAGVVSGGFVPGGDRWGLASFTGIQLVPLGGRLVLASRLRAGLAEGGVEHRLLRLGGSSDVQGLRPDAAVGDLKATGGVELRWQVVRYANLPLPLLWLSDVQLNGGLEAGTLSADGDVCGTPDGRCGWSAAGWTGGIAFTGDVFGARPTMLATWLAGPLATSDAALVDPERPMQIYVRMTQAF